MVADAARLRPRKLLPRVVSAFAEERFDREIMTEMGALGFLGADAAGGLRRRRREPRRLRPDRARDRGDRLRLPLGHERAVVAGHVPDLRVRLGGAAPRWLPGMARGEIIGCFGLTEADGGSDPASMRTRAKEVAGGFVLNGAKMWITNCADRRRGPGLGQARRRSSAASWSSAARGLRDHRRSRTSSPCAPRSPARSRCRTCSCPKAMLPERAGAARAVLLPQQGALRHRLGRDGRGGVLLPRRARLRRQPQACSASRWPRASWCRRSSPTCRPRSRSATKARWRSAA